MFDEADVKDVSEFRDSSEETDFVIGCGSLNGADEAVCSRIGLVGLLRRQPQAGPDVR